MTTPVPITSRTGMFRGNSVVPQTVIDLQGLITQAASQVTNSAASATASAASATAAAGSLADTQSAASAGVANINAAVSAGNNTLNATVASINGSVTTAVSSATSATSSKNAAASSATAAAGSASAAAGSATAASGSASAASTSASNASSSATSAANSAANAQNAAALLASSSNVPYTSNPAMDGTASAGTSGNYARGDHVHPTDTSRAPVNNAGLTGSSTAVNLAVSTTLTLGGVAVATTAAIPTAYASTPAMNGTASAGSSTSWAKGDHVHPSDTSRAPLASPTFTGLVGYNANAAAIPAGPAAFTANTITVNGADSGGTGVVINGYTTVPTIYGRSSSGTGAAPTATAINQTLLQLAGGGYGTTWSAVQGSIQIKASAGWSGTSQPTYITFNNTASGTTSVTERMRITAPGNVLIGTTTDDGVNQLQVAGAAKVAGAATFGSTVALSADPTTALQASTKQYVDNTITSRASMFRNVLHNSTFRVNQRNGGTVTANGGYVADRWTHLDDGATGSRAILLANATDADRAAVGDEEMRYFLTMTTNGGSAAGSYDIVSQKIEGVRSLAGKTVTLSFWAAATAGSSVAVELSQFFGTGGAPSAQVFGAAVSKIALSAAWAKYSTTLTVPSVAGKTLGTNGDDSLVLNIWTNSGTGTASRTNSLGVQTGVTTNLWGLQLEVGSVATPLEKVPMAIEMANCCRYYQIATCSARFTASAAGQVFDTTIGWQMMRTFPTVGGAFAGWSSSNVASNAVYSTYNNGGRLEITSTAAGDCYMLNLAVPLIAEL